MACNICKQIRTLYRACPRLFRMKTMMLYLERPDVDVDL